MFNFSIDELEWRIRTAAEKMEDPIKKIIQSSLRACCTVMVHHNGQDWTGSGFHIGNGLVVTAGHVAPPELINAPSEITLTFDSKTLVPAKVILSDPDIDAAILFSPQVAKANPSVVLGNSDECEIGDIIAVIGSPEGWHDTATVGRVTNIHQYLGTSAPSPAWNDIIFFDADILQGASGGMVITTDGLVVGSVMGVTGQNAQLGLGERAACPSNKIKHLIQQIS